MRRHAMRAAAVQAVALKTVPSVRPGIGSHVESEVRVSRPPTLANPIFRNRPRNPSRSKSFIVPPGSRPWIQDIPGPFESANRLIRCFRWALPIDADVFKGYIDADWTLGHGPGARPLRAPNLF